MAGSKLSRAFNIGIVLVFAFAYSDVMKGQINETWGKVNADLPTQITGEDGGLMVLIPAGEFQMGSNDGAADEKPVHTVYTDAFYMDKYEVTNAQYVRFLNQYGSDTDPDGSRLLYIDNYSLIWRLGGNTYRPKVGYADHPVIKVTWYGALAYANHHGKRLPTEAEWEKAARGGLVRKKYPWGNASPDGAQCNFADMSTNHEWADRNAYDGYQHTAPVGSYTANGYGLHDMAGNVWEWCADWYGWYPSLYERNPVGPASGIGRVLRGGSWNNTPAHLRVACRYSRNPALVHPRASDFIGFRCAKSVMP